MSKKTRILALDPSSTCIGYAVMEGPDAYLEIGLIKPNSAKYHYIDRVRDMVKDLEEMMEDMCLQGIVLEVTSGKSAGRLKKNVQGLAIYGFAVGAVWLRCDEIVIHKKYLHLIPENEWTKGVPKAKRIQAINLIFPAYDPGQDPGGDAADALGLGRYYFLTRKES